jgi:hypothetical protein
MLGDVTGSFIRSLSDQTVTLKKGTPMTLPSTFKTPRQRRQLEQSQRNMEIVVMGLHRQQFEARRQIRNELADRKAAKAERELDYLECVK